ncbi:MAG: magnesium/cobalt transporter CorA [Dehalococcoidia bacterium]|nr:magnesium/cobalt transporter CorA [Dehalococcoidia bacterium]
MKQLKLIGEVVSLSLVYLKDGNPSEEEDRQKIDLLVKQTDAVFWLDLSSPTAEELDWLEQTFSFHPLTIEDLKSENPRPKLEDYPGYVFMVGHSALIQGAVLELTEVHFFVAKQYIITSHADALEQHESFRHDFEGKSSWLRRGTDFCLYRLINDLAKGYLAVVDGIDDELDELQNAILAGTGLNRIDPIINIRRQLATLRRIVSPTREIANELSLHSYPFIQEDTTIYYRDVHNLLVTIFDMAETQRDVASNILDAHLMVVSNRLNDIMKRLTVFASIFLPVSFFAAIGGMNFTALPFDSPFFFAAMMVGLIVVPVLMLIWFRKEGWF